MPHLRIRGVDLYFEECGQGPAVIVAHGALGSVATAPVGLRAIDLAKHEFRVVAYDARGHGRSGWSDEPHDYRREARADDLLGLMDALGISEASIVGSSMGASTSLTLAKRDPGRIVCLVLRSPAPFPEPSRAAQLTMKALSLSYRYLGSTFTSRLGALGSPAASRARLRAILANQPRAVVPMLRGVLSEPLYPPDLVDISAPALIVTHPDDALHPLAAGKAIQSQLRNSVLLEGTSRTYWDAQPERLTDAIAAFLTETSVTAAG